jgi:hypothetical protein
MSFKNIPLDELEPSPIRHTKLPPALVARINAVYLALHDVYPSSLADWLEDFQRDLHPERGGHLVGASGAVLCRIHG